MGIRTGAQYIASLKDDRALYIAGQRVRDVTAYAPLAGILGSIGEHYDAFHKPELQGDYTYPSPGTAGRSAIPSCRRAPGTRCSSACAASRCARRPPLA